MNSTATRRIDPTRDLELVFDAEMEKGGVVHVRCGVGPSCGRRIEDPVLFSDTYSRAADLLCVECEAGLLRTVEGRN